ARAPCIGRPCTEAFQLSGSEQPGPGAGGGKRERFRASSRRHGRRMSATNPMAFSIERETLDRAVAGEPPALDYLLRTIRPHVERQLLRYPVSDEDRRDLLQATLMQIVRRLGSFRAESSFSTWLFRVTANEALML